MEEAAFVDEQIRLLQTPFSITDAPVWEGEIDYPLVSDAALGATISKLNVSLRSDVLRQMGPGPRRSLISQLQGLVAVQKPVSATAASEHSRLLAPFPSQWPDTTTTSAAQRDAYAASRARVFALAQAVAAAKEELAGRRQVLGLVDSLRERLQHEHQAQVDGTSELKNLVASVNGFVAEALTSRGRGAKDGRSRKQKTPRKAAYGSETDDVASPPSKRHHRAE